METPKGNQIVRSQVGFNDNVIGTERQWDNYHMKQGRGFFVSGDRLRSYKKLFASVPRGHSMKLGYR